MKWTLALVFMIALVEAEIWQDAWRDADGVTYDSRRQLLLQNQFNISRFVPVTVRMNFTQTASPACMDSNGDYDLLDVGEDIASLRVVRAYPNGTLADAAFHIANATTDFACQNGGLLDFNIIFLANLTSSLTDEGSGYGVTPYWIYYDDSDIPLYSNSTLRTDLSNSGGGVWTQLQTFSPNMTDYLHDYQVNITLNTASLISNGLVKSDCSDIRAVSNGVERYFWVDKCNSANTEVWVRLPALNKSSDVTIYYGNPLATDSANGAATFIAFDDFNDASPNTNVWDWYYEGGGVSILSNRLYVRSNYDYTSVWLKNALDLPKAAIDYKMYYTAGGAGGPEHNFSRQDGLNVTSFNFNYATREFKALNQTELTLIGKGMSTTVPLDEVSLYWDNSRTVVGARANENITEFIPHNSILGENLLNVFFGVSNNAQTTFNLDDFRVRNYTYNEPSLLTGFNYTFDCPKIFPWCCNATEHYYNGICCSSTETCCLTTDDCDTDEVCDQRENYHFCYINKENGVSCTAGADCASNYCNSYCCSSEAALVSDVIDCEEGVGGRCAYWDSGGLSCCSSDSDCSPTGYFCQTKDNVHQCLTCKTTSNDICSSSACVGYDPDCCNNDADCANGKWCTGGLCVSCGTTIDLNCTSQVCLGYDPDCCDATHPCTIGLICETSNSPPSCVAPVGNVCDDDTDCQGSSICRSRICALSEFVFIDSTDYASTLGDSLEVKVTIIDPIRKSGTYRATIEGTGRHFATFPGSTQEFTFNIGNGETKRIPIMFSSGALGNYEVRVKVWNLQHTAIVTTKTFFVTVQGETSAPLMMSAPGLDALSIVSLFMIAAGFFTFRR